MLLEVQTSDFAEILKSLPHWMIFIVIMTVVAISPTLNIIRLVVDRIDKKKTRRIKASESLQLELLYERLLKSNDEMIKYLSLILDVQQGQVKNICNLQGLNGIIEAYYERSMLQIQSLLAKIYIDNHIYDPGRKEVISEDLTNNIKNLYRRDIGELVLLRYKNRKLSDYMKANIDPNILIEGIIDRMFNKGFGSKDMHAYIENCFNKYITETEKHYEAI